MGRTGTFFGVIVFFFFSAVGVPGQEGLYAPVRPENTAFVRVAALVDTRPLMIGSVRFPALSAGEVTPYRLVPVDGYVLGGRGGAFFTPEAGHFYTVVRDRDPIFTVIDDEAHNDRARAQVNLYNFTNYPLSLRALRPAGTILDAVPPGQRNSRSLNAITVDVQVFSGEVPYGNLHTIQMLRGGSYSLFAYEQTNGAGVTVAAEASVSAE